MLLHSEICRMFEFNSSQQVFLDHLAEEGAQKICDAMTYDVADQTIRGYIVTVPPKVCISAQVPSIHHPVFCLFWLLAPSCMEMYGLCVLLHKVMHALA